MEYIKINGIYKRYQGETEEKPFYSKEKRGDFIIGEFSQNEFKLLENITWEWTEKIDGTNIRVDWISSEIDYDLIFKGRTDNAQIPANLFKKLGEIFVKPTMKELFLENSITLYGEGFGAKIQKGGGNYNPDDVDFILFDIKIGNWWLKRCDVEDIASKLKINCVPIVGEGTIQQAIDFVKKGFYSTFSTEKNKFYAEGLVLRPKEELFDRAGRRIITKIKRKDFIKM